MAINRDIVILLLSQNLIWITSYSAHFVPTDAILRQAARCEGVDAITTDGIHLTPHGNTLLADFWHQAFTALSPD